MPDVSVETDAAETVRAAFESAPTKTKRTASPPVAEGTSAAQPPEPAPQPALAASRSPEAGRADAPPLVAPDVALSTRQRDAVAEAVMPAPAPFVADAWRDTATAVAQRLATSAEQSAAPMRSARRASAPGRPAMPAALAAVAGAAALIAGLALVLRRGGSRKNE
ncbi:MAG: hypothetical protein HYX50_05710 [Chloroflexi bacterium]|nr:hypothetical protein [Chloroflexota bacterium]